MSLPCQNPNDKTLILNLAETWGLTYPLFLLKAASINSLVRFLTRNSRYNGRSLVVAYDGSWPSQGSVNANLLAGNQSFSRFGRSLSY